MARRAWNFLAGGFLMGVAAYMAVSMLALEPQVWVLLVVGECLGF